MTAPTAPTASPLPTVTLQGLQVHALTEDQCVQHVVDEILAGRGGTIVTPNLDHLRRYTRDGEFQSLVNACTLRVADGMPLVWASRVQGTPLPERVAGSNLILSLSQALSRHQRSVFLLGGDPGTAEAAATALQARFPGLRIAGTHFPPFGFDKDANHMALIREQIGRTRPDLVFVAVGSPKQERVIHQIKDCCPTAWWAGVGISFSFVTGDVKRAPRWMQKVGLEWSHRLMQEPRRLFRRYIIDGLPFFAALLLRSVRARFAGPRPTGA